MTDEIKNEGSRKPIPKSLRLRQYRAIHDAIAYRVLCGNPIDNLVELLSDLQPIYDSEEEEQS